MRVIILMAVCLLHAAYAAPQFLTFKDGKIGVNFGGYNAEAGLGGLLTGDAAHGGLSASAGTPWGPRAAAGLGGSVDGRSSGFGYASAEANPSVGASAALGGSAGEHGFIGSEAHVNGKVSSNSLSLAGQPHIAVRSDAITSGPPLQPPTVYEPPPTEFIQKIKPPKKYHLISNEDTHMSPTSSTAAAPDAAVTDFKANRSISASKEIVAAANSNDNPALMINVHRQRLRERRRQQLDQEQALEETERRRQIEQRARNRQRLHPRRHEQKQRLVTRSKTVDINALQNDAKKNNVTTRATDSMQHSINTDYNAVHSKHAVKSFHKSLGASAPGVIPAPPPPPPPPGFPIDFQYHSNPGVLNNALNIPIGILRVIQESLTGIAQEKSYSG